MLTPARSGVARSGATRSALLTATPAPIVRPDSSDIDAAVIARLVGDATLHSLMPDGVYVDEAAPGSKRFVIVSLVTTIDVGEFGRRAFEDVTYLVKAVALSSTGASLKDAAARIDVLLEDVPLTIAGFRWMATYRIERVRYAEVDEVDRSIRWQHRGGRYRVMAAPLVTG